MSLPQQQTGIIVYVIYSNPKDFPGNYVVRKWTDDVPDQYPIYVGDSLHAARCNVPKGHIRLDRMDGDDVAILETYI